MESNTVNVRDLPTTQEVINGDYIIVEKQTGSHVIDFRDFVVGPSNTSFYNALVTNIKAVSTYSLSLSTTIQRNSSQTVNEVQANFVTLTAAWSKVVPRWFIREDLLTLQENANLAFVDFQAPVPDIGIRNVTIHRQKYEFVPGDNTPLKPYLIDVQVIGQTVIGDSPVYTYRLSLSSLSAYSTDTTYDYAVLKAYYQ